MESSNQGTKRWNKPKTTNPRERNNKEDNRQNRDKNSNRNFEEENTSKETAKSQKYKEIHEKRNNRVSIVCILTISRIITTVRSSKKRR